MKEHQQIDKMLAAGKLSAAQATLLKASLKASKARKPQLDRTVKDGNDGPKTGRFWMVAGGLFLILLFALVLSTGNRPLFFFLLLILFSLGCAATVFLIFFNVLIWKKERVARTRALIANEVERKETLLPQIQESVSAYASLESGTHAKVVQERAATAAHASGDALNMTPASPSFQALVEQYPDIKSDQTYLQLFNQLVETENRITAMVKWYNNIVHTYNSTLEAFPFFIVADAFSFKKANYLESP